MHWSVNDRGTLRRRVIAWVAAYALVLQSVLAPIAALAAGAPDAGAGAAPAFCLEHAAAAASSDQAPASPQQHDDACKLCIACALDANLPPAPAITRTVAEAVSPVGWPAVSQHRPDGTRLSGRSARGPPRGA